IMNKEKLVLNSDLKNSFLYKQNSTIFQNASFSLTKDNRVLTPSDIHKMLIDFSNSFKLD
ncbi:MAG: hypothetical protein K2F52_02080, partial [Malacoplasma sp.]|nr:hypothetical protein [Malacoplasma sp.]